METWLEINEFCKLVRLDRSVIEDMIKRGNLKTKDEDGKIMIEASKGTNSIMPSRNNLEKINENALIHSEDFVEKTIGTILNLHEKVLDAKDETLDILRSENKFLKDALLSMQDLYEEDRRTIEALSVQLKSSQEEIDFLKRKYRLMWDKTVDNYKN